MDILIKGSESQLSSLSQTDTTGLGQKIRSGTLWSFIGNALLQFLSLSTTVVLARLLSPQDFGVVAIAMTVWGIIQLFGSMGIGAKLIQQPDDVSRYASAAFWLNITIALCLSILTVIVAPFVASFYKNNLVKPILMVMGLGFFLDSFGTVHSVLLVKELDFKKRTLVDIAINLVTRAITILMAFVGYGVWSLVIPQILSSPIRVFALWKICPWRPNLEFNFLYWKRIFNFGKYILGTDLLRYINLNGDYTIVGRFLGPLELGLYTFAYKLAMFPLENIVGVVYKVSFPAFSMLQNDLNRLREAFLKMTRLLSLISFPLFIGLMAMANELIPAVFGEKWNRSIVPLQIIIGFAMINSFVSPCGQIVLTLERPEIEFKFNLIQAPLLLGGIFIGVKYGIIGVAVAMSLVIGIMALVFLKLSINLIGLGIKDILNALFPALSSSLIMLIPVLLIRYLLLYFGCRGYQVLLICIPFCGFMYLLALLTFFKNNFQMIWNMFMDISGHCIISLKRVYVHNP